MIGAFLKYFGIPVAFTWFMSTKTFDGKSLMDFEVCHCLCTATKADLCRKKSSAKEATKAITAVRVNFMAYQLNTLKTISSGIKTGNVMLTMSLFLTITHF